MRKDIIAIKQEQKFFLKVPLESKKDLIPWKLKIDSQGFPGGAVVENLPANAGDMGSIPGPGGSHMPWSN